MSTPNLDIHYVPTPPYVVDLMLDLAQVRPGELVYDLGCGDGRIVRTAAQKYGARAIGFDLDADLVRTARAHVQQEGLTGQVAIQHGNFFEVDLRPADVVTLYLLSYLNARLLPRLLLMKPGARIVSHIFPLRGFPPHQTAAYRDAQGREREVYRWVCPLCDPGPAR